ncbi:hypothetical protein FSARC_5970 [Fusarium sarcochroum]|uniref:Nucleoside phosphorylase domain-containing protein n=1 Tax=Fusarium sarcochroum TaxID=1208366 RepID=A0A8H4TYE9_9HYPO|nr:hypothetical protein FSARC_5970 [Fusarium sarcochroum]
MAEARKNREDFHIAIVCALALEYNAVSRIIDEFWDDAILGRSAGDPNTYSVGRIADSNVVLVLLSGMGKVSAASATASLRSSFSNLELVLVTGICGGVPKPHANEELLLGDVIISKAVVQHDLGRRYPDRFEIKDTLDDRLGRPTRNIRNFIALFETDRARDRLEEKAALNLGELQSRAKGKRRAANYQYPGADKDHLFNSSYLHKHHSTCNTCSDSSDNVCEASRKLSCRELGCDEQQLIQRDRLTSKDAQDPFVFIGHLGSGDAVIKSGQERDRLAQAHNLIAFEMEGAGVWDEIPCIIVKGVCDYADSHKNKDWQNFAAATAAALSKALIEEYPKTDKPSKQVENSGDDGGRAAVSGPVFHGTASGNNVVTGVHSSGGTQTFNFG